MNKFIQLGNGPYIPANTIRKITGPYGSYVDHQYWYFVVSYKLDDSDIESYIVELNKTFVKDESNAKHAMTKFVERLNKLL